MEKYATAVVYEGTHFFPQLQGNSRSHSNARNTLISSKKHASIKNGKEIDNSTKNLSRITDGHQNYEQCKCKGKIVIGA